MSYRHCSSCGSDAQSPRKELPQPRRVLTSAPKVRPELLLGLCQGPSRLWVCVFSPWRAVTCGFREGNYTRPGAAVPRYLQGALSNRTRLSVPVPETLSLKSKRRQALPLRLWGGGVCDWLMAALLAGLGICSLWTHHPRQSPHDISR